MVNNPAITPTPSKVGSTHSCGMRIGFNETVGTRLIISSAMPASHTALTYGDRAIQSPHSKLTNIGTSNRPAPAGAGAPVKKAAAQGGGTMRTPDETVTVIPGSFVVHPPGELHEWITGAERTLLFRVRYGSDMSGRTKEWPSNPDWRPRAEDISYFSSR